MKKRHILYFIVLSMLFACEGDRIDVTNSINGENEGTRSAYSPALENPNVKKGTIRIKLRENFGDDLRINLQNGIVQSNVTPLNALLSNIKATSMQRLFPYAGKYEERTRREGLHLWYVVDFDESVLVSNAVQEAKKLKEVQIVEEVFKIEPPKVIKSNVEKTLSGDKNPFNDPMLTDQWHYQNKGLFPKSIAGADINLFKAWEMEVGKPNVIVSVVDGGVDYTHEDLKESMYVNEAELKGEAGVDDDGNGYVDDVYGYNFVTNSAKISFEEHGTHVAGTIAARNNNGVGVCGIAGGNGTPDSGVRLMTCGIFAGKKGGDASAAIKYGADNGAVISQNSWGYPFPGPGNIPDSEKAAIDYFVKYAGCDNDGNQLPDSPMKGGVVIFAAGNDNVEFNAYPAAYEPTVAVSAMAPDWSKAWYSNSGTWVDIMAPGGDQYFPKGQVLSTVPGGYAYMQGTSMACPHVSGVAALIVSKFGGQGFTNEDLKKRLLTGLRPVNIDVKNPTLVGKLGAGYVDAYSVLAEEKDNEAPETPKFIKIVPDFTSLNVQWEAVKDANDVTPVAYMLYYSEQKLGEDNYKEANHIKVNGFGYEVNSPISYSVDGLPLNTVFYFAIEAVDRWGATSGVAFTEGKTKENHAPIITKEGDPSLRLKDSEVVTLNLKVTDPDEGQKWTYKLEGDMHGVICNKAEDGLMLKFRVKEPLGKYSLKITVVDNFGAATEIEIPFEYYKNEPPKVSKKIEKVYAPIKKVYTIDLNQHFSDPDGSKLTYTVKVLGETAKVEVVDNMLTIHPEKYGIGSIQIVATDVDGAKVKTNFEVQTVNDDIVYIMYPVPVKKILHVRLSNEVSSAKLKIRTASNSLILEKEVSVKDGNRMIDLDLSDVAGGTYVLYVEANGKTFKQSFIKY